MSRLILTLLLILPLQTLAVEAVAARGIDQSDRITAEVGPSEGDSARPAGAVELLRLIQTGAAGDAGVAHPGDGAVADFVGRQVAAVSASDRPAPARPFAETLPYDSTGPPVSG